MLSFLYFRFFLSLYYSYFTIQCRRFYFIFAVESNIFWYSPWFSTSATLLYWYTIYLCGWTNHLNFNGIQILSWFSSVQVHQLCFLTCVFLQIPYFPANSKASIVFNVEFQVERFKWWYFGFGGWSTLSVSYINFSYDNRVVSFT